MNEHIPKTEARPSDRRDIRGLGTLALISGAIAAGAILGRDPQLTADAMIGAVTFGAGTVAALIDCRRQQAAAPVTPPNQG